MIWWPVTTKTATLSGWDKKILKLSAKYVGLQFYEYIFMYYMNGTVLSQCQHCPCQHERVLKQTAMCTTQMWALPTSWICLNYTGLSVAFVDLVYCDL